MAFPSIYSPETTAELLQRLDRIQANQAPLWGKMNAAQMCAHCCIPYEQILGENTKQAPLMMRIFLRLFYKKHMVNDKPYAKNLPTAPSFIRADEHEFLFEKNRLQAYIQSVHGLGPEALSAKTSLSLGKLSALEWNNLLYKHLHHHLCQFGV